MKRYHIFLLMQLLGLLSVCPVVLSAPVAQPDEGNALVSSVMSERATVVCRTGEPVDVRLGCFSLSADSGSLLHDMDMRVTVLPLGECAVLRSEMSNVTAGGDGVRLLPNGTHFSENSPARITLAYDPQRIPDNYRAEDIYTFCCEQTGEQWYRLERISIDTITHTITSLTSHFTDFANAIISLPELPESSAYVPTTLTDLPDPDPLQGIPMVQVNGLGSFGSPTGDNSGNASLTYPIVIPAGRHGLQPDVNLYYNSANGNGPLGVGWSIPMPAVTIDTRWGVPRYDALRETEAYLVNGEPIVMHTSSNKAEPLPHQAATFMMRSHQTERFWFRDTRNASRVIRHGQNTTNYWWEVTTTSGLTYYYGRKFDPNNPLNDAIDENNVLRDADNNIGYWALTAMVDLDGNYVLYNYFNSENNIFLNTIEYTGNHQTGTLPTYRIDFSWWYGRKDEFSDGRLGFLRKTNRRLCQIGVTYNNQDISRYYLTYDCSEFSSWKSRLLLIQKSDVDAGNAGRECDYLEHQLSHTHNFEGSQTEFTYNNAPQTMFGSSRQLINSGADISKSKSGTWNLGGTATVGLFAEVYKTTFSGGGHYNFSMQYGKMESMLLDLNGDALPDLVYQDGNQIKYRPQIQGSGNSNNYFGSEVVVPGLPRLSRDVSRTHNWGLQLSFVACLSYSNPITLSYTDYFFSDINADGLPDMVTPNGILFNHLSSQGHPSFSPYTGQEVIAQHNTGCPTSGMHYTGAVDTRLECEVHEVAVDSVSLSVLPSDPGWNEPYDFDPHQFSEDGYLHASDWHPLPTDNHRSSSPEDSGSSEQDSRNDTADTSEQSAPEDSDGVSSDESVQQVRSIPDGFYENGYTYRVERGKIIKYGLESTCHDDNPDPVIENVRVWVADRTDTVQWISSTVSLRQDHSVSRQHARKADGVRCVIQLNRYNQTNGSHFTSTQATILHTDTIAADDYNPKTYTSSGFVVNAGDMILFRLCSGDNSMYDDVDWSITIQHKQNNTIYQANAAQDYICTGERPFTTPLTGDAIIRYKAENDYTSSVNLSFVGSNKPAIAIAGNTTTNGDFVAYDTILNITQGTTIKPVITGNANTDWSRVHIHPEIEFRYHFSDVANNLDTYDTTFVYPDVNYPCSAINVDSVYRILFGKLYKGWGRFAYRPRNNSDTLDLCSLINTERLAQSSAQQNSSTWQNLSTPQDSSSLVALGENGVSNLFAAQDLYNPLSDTSTWVPVYPDSRTERWIPYGNLGYICSTGQSNCRNMQPTPEESRAFENLSTATNDTIEDIPYYDSAIPASGIASTRKAPLKSTKSVQHSLSGGLPIMNTNVSWGTYSVETDFIDLNGDGFPDAVGPSGVQYSNPWGGLGDLRDAHMDGHESNNFSSGLNFSGSPASMKKMAGNSVNKPGFTMEGSGGGLSHNEGETETDRMFVDMNGDGLPDIVSRLDTTIRYNLGYKFTAPVKITCSYFRIQHGSSESNGANGAVGMDWMQAVSGTGLAIEQYSLSGGLDGSVSENLDDAQLMDMNGDGLPDMVWRASNGNLTVCYNLGMKFNETYTHQVIPTSLQLQSPAQKSHSWNLGASVSGTLGITFMGIGKACFGLNGGGGYSESHTDISFMDMNGDGFPDQVSREQNGRISVRYNQAVGTNLLTCVTNPTGQQIHLGYALSSPSKQHRQRQWHLDTIADIDVANPWVERQLVRTTKTYNSPYYDNHERTDYGYAHILTNESSMRTTEENYINTNYLRRGRKADDLLINASGDRCVGHQYSYAFCQPNGTPADWICNDGDLYATEDAIYTDYYEGDYHPQITTRVRMRYDFYYNLKEYFDDGDANINTDDWHRTITYMPTTYKNLVSLPMADSVMTSGGNLLRLRYARWYNTGRLHQMLAIDPLTNVGALTSLLYDNFGNVIEYRLPKNEHNERVNYTIQYEGDLNALPFRVSNQFGEEKRTFYNPRWGVPTLTIDPDGSHMRYIYDYMGRLTHVIAPQEDDASHYGWSPHGSNTPYTIRYTYNNIHHNLADLVHDTLQYMYVLKQSISRYEFDPVIEATIYSARGEKLQKKKQTMVFGNVENLTDGHLDVDALGRITHSWYPSISSSHLWEYDDISNSTGGLHTRKWYDVLNRDTLTRLPDASEVHKSYSCQYDCRGNLRLFEDVIDPLSNHTRTFTAPQGWTTSTEMADGSTTCYDYNCIGELTQVTDADSYQTTYTYNGFGQQIERNHPDAGVTRWRYDATGNLVCSRTQKQYDINDSTTYHYYFGRLMEIHHAVHPWENVSFNYDMAGRLALREDRTGGERIWYDELGQVRQTLRRIILPTDVVAFQFMTQYSYDSFGRIRQMVYPDAEKVDYLYKIQGGDLFAVVGAQVKVNDIIYDELGHIVHKQYLNGCYSNYQYDSDRQWLKNISSKSAFDGNAVFQNLWYTYDAVGNPYQIYQFASAWHGMGDSYQDEYIYDNRYRLARNLHSDGYTGYTDYRMAYSPTTRIGSKYSDHPVIGSPDLIYGYDANGWTHQPRVIFDFYTHQRLQLYWDRNGNLRQIQPADGYARFHLWDDDNKLLFSVGPTTCGYYGNASDGKRAYKMSGDFNRSSVNGGSISGMAYFDKTTLYPNQYMTLSLDGYTKHYFMGAERFCTTIGGGNNGNWLVYPYDNLSQQEQSLLYTLQTDYTYRHSYYDIYDYVHHPSHTDNTDYTGHVQYWDATYEYYQYKADEQYYGNISLEFKQPFWDYFNKYYQNDKKDDPYYYHSDHLGSAAWITDNSGLPTQYIMYAPYGEERLNQHPFFYRERFTFTGKERDIETGYDYFGARNYLPAFSIWGAVDPLVDKYIYNSPYVYCEGNPVKFVDPDGRDIVVGTWYGRLLATFGVNNFEAKTIQRLKDLKSVSPELNNAISSMESNKDVTVNIQPMYKYEGEANKGTTVRNGNSSDIYYHEDVGFIVDGNYSSPDAILAHELGHAENNMNGTNIVYDHKEARKPDGSQIEKMKGNANEKKSIYYENQVRQKEGEPARSYDYYKVNNDSNQ